MHTLSSRGELDTRLSRRHQVSSPSQKHGNLGVQAIGATGCFGSKQPRSYLRQNAALSGSPVAERNRPRPKDPIITPPMSALFPRTIPLIESGPVIFSSATPPVSKLFRHGLLRPRDAVWAYQPRCSVSILLLYNALKSSHLQNFSPQAGPTIHSPFSLIPDISIFQTLIHPLNTPKRARLYFTTNFLQS